MFQKTNVMCAVNSDKLFSPINVVVVKLLIIA